MQISILSHSMQLYSRSPNLHNFFNVVNFRYILLQDNGLSVG